MGLMDLFKPVQIPPLPDWDEGPDDLTPQEPDRHEVIVTKQWGLRLPDGFIAWNSWQGIPFDNPMDRIHMAAKLQQTAQDVGWGQDEFLANYGWVTRNQYATVRYELTEAYTILDPAVSATEPTEGEEQ